MNKNDDDAVVSNHEIKYSQVRVIGDDKSEVGVMSSTQAVELANSQDLDLVLVTDKATPPVCRIVSLNKYNYELKKFRKDRDKKNRKNRTIVKEVNFRPSIGEHDLLTKLNQISKFISNGDSVKISVQFKGRELSHKKRGFDLIERIIDVIDCKVDSPSNFSGYRITSIISPEANNGIS